MDRVPEVLRAMAWASLAHLIIFFKECSVAEFRGVLVFMIPVISPVVCAQSMAMASPLNFCFYSHSERPGQHGETQAASACPEPGATTVRKCLQKFTGSFQVPEPLRLPL